MLQFRPRHRLDHADFGWLKAHHHFAVSPDGNQAHAPLGPLIVWNDDEIAPGKGFGAHSHRDMEIITYVRQGAVTHEDSVGSIGVTEAGDVQVMSTGTGITHSERNDGDMPLKIFQIWLQPRTRGTAPHWGQRRFPVADRSGRLVILASGLGDAGALPIDADARVFGASLLAGQAVDYALAPGRQAYLAPSRGRLRVNGVVVATGDGIAARAEPMLRLIADEDVDFILVDAG